MQTAAATPEPAANNHEPAIPVDDSATRRPKRRREHRRHVDARPPARALNTSGACHYCGFSEPYFKRARRVGGGPPYILVGRSVRYLVDDIDRWLADHRVEK